MRSKCSRRGRQGACMRVVQGPLCTRRAFKITNCKTGGKGPWWLLIGLQPGAAWARPSSWLDFAAAVPQHRRQGSESCVQKLSLGRVEAVDPLSRARWRCPVSRSAARPCSCSAAGRHVIATLGAGCWTHRPPAAPPYRLLCAALPNPIRHPPDGLAIPAGGTGSRVGGVCNQQGWEMVGCSAESVKAIKRGQRKSAALDGCRQTRRATCTRQRSPRVGGRTTHSRRVYGRGPKGSSS